MRLHLVKSSGLILPAVALVLLQLAEGRASNPIRTVDFRNFTYEPACDETKVSVKNGRFDRTDPLEPMHFSVREVLYGDLKRNGEEQAVVLTSCNLGGTGIFSEGFVFALQDGEPILVARIEGGDRASGGIARTSIEGHMLKVSREFGVALCCANYIETKTYVLDGGHLRAAGNPTRVAAPGNSPIRTLRFERGSISGTITGEITANGDQYSVRARSAQVLEAEPLDEGSSQVDLQLISPDGTVLPREENDKQWRFRLELTGTYDLIVTAAESNVPYSLKITVR